MGATTQGVTSGGAGGAHHGHRLAVLNQGALVHCNWFPEEYLKWVRIMERGRQVVQLLVEREEALDGSFRISEIEADVLAELHENVGVTMVTFKFPELFRDMADELVLGQFEVREVIQEWLHHRKFGGERPTEVFKRAEEQMLRISLLINGEKLPFRS